MPSTAPCNIINNAVALTHDRPRPVHGFTTAVKKRPSASELSPPALSQQRSPNTASVTGHGYHRCRDRRKGKLNGNHKQCRAPLSIMRPLCPLTMPFFDSCGEPML